MIVLNAAYAVAPAGFFEQWETLRAITPGRNARSARLLGVPCKAQLIRRCKSDPANFRSGRKHKGRSRR